MTGQLDHPGIVPVHELGVDAENRVYFTMRLVRGEELSAIIDKVHAGDKGWDLNRTLGVFIKICEAMSYAHDKGVVHRDLKPANVMIGKYGEAYVMDWGLARVQNRPDARDIRIRDVSVELTTDRADARATGGSPLLTMDNAVVGTPCYMPPEQAAGRVSEVGPRSDIYAVGAMLYQLLTGQRPYHAPGEDSTPLAVLARVLGGPPTVLRELVPSAPDSLVATCAKAMARDPRERHGSMSELEEEIRSFLYRTPPKLSSKSGSLLRIGESVTTFCLAVLPLFLLLLFLPSSETGVPRLVKVLQAVGLVTLTFFGLYHLRHLLRSMQRGRFFGLRNVARARLMSTLAIWFALVSFVGRFVYALIAGSGYDPIPEQGEIMALLAAFVLGILAEAYRYGTQLQEQVG